MLNEFRKDCRRETTSLLTCLTVNNSKNYLFGRWKREGGRETEDTLTQVVRIKVTVVKIMVH